jgi:hypothetical protein
MTNSIGGKPGATRDRVRTARRDGTAGLSLTRWRRWFAEGDANQDNGTGDNGGGSADPLDAWLKALPTEAQAGAAALVKELRDTRKEAADRRNHAKTLEEQQAKAEAERKSAEAKRLAEQGEWQKLAEQRAADLEKLQPIQQQLEAYQARVKATNDARIAKLPEPMQKLVPANYSVVELSEWLDANYDTLVKPTAPNLDPGKKDGKGNQAPPKDQVLGKKRFARY